MASAMALPSASGSLRNLRYAARTSRKIRTGNGPPTMCAVPCGARADRRQSQSVVGPWICARLEAYDTTDEQRRFPVYLVLEVLDVGKHALGQDEPRIQRDRGDRVRPQILGHVLSEPIDGRMCNPVGNRRHENLAGERGQADNQAGPELIISGAASAEVT